MRFYHFVNEYFGIKDLQEKRLKIARIMELNDPFEFLGMDLSNPEFRRAMNSTKKAFSKDRGILCFSKDWNNPLQWAHYADNHKGICLGFDIPSEKLTKVRYVEERIAHNGQINDDQMIQFLSTKFQHWSYEQEYRGFYRLEDEIDGIYYVDFSETLKLSQVIVGARSSITHARISALVDSCVEVFKARAAFKTFRVVRNKNEDLWAYPPPLYLRR